MHLHGLSIILMTSYQITSAATFYERVIEHEDHPGMCYIAATGTAHEDGSSWTSESFCARSICSGEDLPSPNGKKYFLIEHQTCGAASAEPPCKVVEDKEAQYPFCCPRFECPSVDDV